MAHHRNILIKLDGTASEDEAKVFKTKKVFFYPASSEQTVTITFCDRVPFNDWDNKNTTTGDKGKPVKGTVARDADGEYKYDPGNEPCDKRGNPKLIVDGK